MDKCFQKEIEEDLKRLKWIRVVWLIAIIGYIGLFWRDFIGWDLLIFNKDINGGYILGVTVIGAILLNEVFICILKRGMKNTLKKNIKVLDALEEVTGSREGIKIEGDMRECIFIQEDKLYKVMLVRDRYLVLHGDVVLNSVKVHR